MKKIYKSHQHKLNLLIPIIACKRYNSTHVKLNKFYQKRNKCPKKKII